MKVTTLKGKAEDSLLFVASEGIVQPNVASSPVDFRLRQSTTGERSNQHHMENRD